MRGIPIRSWLLLVLLAGGIAACDSGAVQPGIVNTSSNTSAQAGPIGSGRVVSINEVALRGAGGRSGNGPLLGGLLGAAGGAAIGAGTSGTFGGGLVGGLLGAVGGAIAGSLFDSRGGAMSGGRGIEVTVQKDDGQRVTVAQRDDGDVQLGDRVQIVQDRNGVAKVVRDNSRTVDRSQSALPSQGGGPQESRQSQSYPQPQNDPRYGNLN